MSIKEITNYIQVSDCIASSGQPEYNQFDYIASAGYEIVINLAMPDSYNAIPEEGNIITTLKMSYIHIPVPFESPNKSQLNIFLNIMDSLSDKKIWVHCVVNYRVSAFLYLYWRLVLKASPEESQKVILPSWKPNDVWQKFMRIGENENEL